MGHTINELAPHNSFRTEMAPLDWQVSAASQYNLQLHYSYIHQLDTTSLLVFRARKPTNWCDLLENGACYSENQPSLSNSTSSTCPQRTKSITLRDSIPYISNIPTNPTSQILSLVCCILFYTYLIHFSHVKFNAHGIPKVKDQFSNVANRNDPVRYGFTFLLLHNIRLRPIPNNRSQICRSPELFDEGLFSWSPYTILFIMAVWLEHPFMVSSPMHN